MALREAKRWAFDIMHWKYNNLKIFNNLVVHLSYEDHEKLMSLQDKFNVCIREFFREGKGGIIIRGEPVGVSCAALEVEATLCQARDNFVRNEERDLACMYCDFEQIEKTRMFAVLHYYDQTIRSVCTPMFYVYLCIIGLHCLY